MKITLILTALWLGSLGLKPARPNSGASPNPLTLNGHPLNVNALTMYSQGVLAVVEGDPRSPRHRPTPFRVVLRRAGTIVRQWPAADGRAAYSFSLDALWPFARLGDELTIESRAPDLNQPAAGRTSRTIQLVAFPWFWSDGC